MLFIKFVFFFSGIEILCGNSLFCDVELWVFLVGILDIEMDFVVILLFLWVLFDIFYDILGLVVMLELEDNFGKN